MFECPYKPQLANGTMVCDWMCEQHPADVKQCPTDTFNKCQEQQLNN